MKQLENNDNAITPQDDTVPTIMWAYNALSKSVFNTAYKKGLVKASLHVTRFSLNVITGFPQIQLKLGFLGTCLCRK